MTATTDPPFASPDADVVPLAPRDAARFDPVRLDRLYAELGRDAAESTLTRALDTLGERLDEVQIRSGYERRRAARRAVGVAEEVGLVTLAAAAEGVADAAGRDPVADAATLARLVRVGEASLTALWSDEDPA